MSSNTNNRAIRFLISYEFFFHLLAASASMLTALLFLYKIQIWEVFNLIPSKVFVGFIFLNRFLGLLYEVKKERWHALLSAGILIVISGFVLNYAYRFEGIAGIGEGESFVDYDLVEKGPLSKPPKFAIAVEEIQGVPLKPDKSVKIKVRNEKKELVGLFTGQSVRWSSANSPTLISWVSPIKIKVIRVEPAPRFLITDGKGKDLHSAFVKLNLYPIGREDYFRSPAVPHRFYMNLTGKADKPFNIKVVRGKLIIVNKEIAIGEEVAFEGLNISFPEISKWAEIEIKYYPGNKLILIGIVMAIAGLLRHVFKKLKVK